jgi:pyruvate-ferredoxin/flavodoxin oxidoreductase
VCAVTCSDRIGATLGWTGAAAAAPASASAAPRPKPRTQAGSQGRAALAAIAYEPVWVETPECSACDECTTLAPSVFAYNDQRKAVVTNPKGASYADLVRAAEKCTAGCLHPGTPWNPAEPGLDAPAGAGRPEVQLTARP